MIRHAHEIYAKYMDLCGQEFANTCGPVCNVNTTFSMSSISPDTHSPVRFSRRDLRIGNFNSNQISNRIGG